MNTVRTGRLLVVIAAVMLSACQGDAAEEETVPEARTDTLQPEVIINETPLEEVVDSAVTATFADGRLTLEPTLVGRGPVTLMIVNNDDDAHALEIVSPTGGRWRALPAPPGSSGMSLSMVLNPGEHDVYSTTAREQGMAAVLTVR